MLSIKKGIHIQVELSPVLGIDDFRQLVLN